VVLAGAGALLLFGLVLDAFARLGTPARRERSRRHWRERQAFLPSDRRELLHSLPLALAAAVGEEIAFRGFLVGYVRAIAPDDAAGIALAVGLPAVAFALAHLYQGALAGLEIALFSAGLGLLFLWTGSLALPIAIHLCVDLFGLAMSPRLLRGEPLR
jgi:membrane protease YdiL (CAAX protease family)